MWLRIGAIVLCVLVIVIAAWEIMPWFEIRRWAAGEQRMFQNMMAGALEPVVGTTTMAILVQCAPHVTLVWWLCLTDEVWSFRTTRTVATKL